MSRIQSLFLVLFSIFAHTAEANYFTSERVTKGEKAVVYFLSIGFWLLLILVWYVYDKYKTARDKKRYLQSSFLKAIVYPIGIVFTVVVLLNIWSPKGNTVEPEIVPIPLIKKELLEQKENVLKQEVENDFLNATKTLQYIDHHFHHVTNPQSNYTVLNFYIDKTYADDPIFRDMGQLGIAYSSLQLDQLSYGLAAIAAIENKKKPAVAFVEGFIRLKQEDTTQAIELFEQELSYPGYAASYSAYELALLYQSQKNYEKLIPLVTQYSLEDVLTTTSQLKVMLANHEYLGYLGLQLSLSMHTTSLFFYLCALLVALVWAYYLFKIDLYEKEKPSILVVIFICGIATNFVSYIVIDFIDLTFQLSGRQDFGNELFLSIFKNGVVKEIFKLLPLLILLKFTKQVNETYDYILYAGISALGFALAENIGHVNTYSIFAVQGQIFLTTLTHFIHSAFFAYGLVLAKYRYAKSPTIALFFAFLLLAATCSGLFELMLQYNSIYSIALFVYIEVALFTIALNNCLNNSTFFSYSIKPTQQSVDSFLSISLVSLLMLQYCFIGFQNGITTANKVLLLSLISGGAFIPFFVLKLSRLDMVKGHWFGFYNPIQNSFEQDRGGKSFISTIVGDSIKPHNYVGIDINFKPDRQNNSLKNYIPGLVDATISDRWVLPAYNKNTGKKVNDPYWFLLTLAQPLILSEGTYTHALIKFKYTSPDIYQTTNIEAYLYTMPVEYSTEPRDLRANELTYRGKISLTSVIEKTN